MAFPTEGEREVTIEELLYQWGDESRSSAERLGLPATSGIARMIQQQLVFERQRRGARRKKPKRTDERIALRDGTVATVCVCGMIRLDGDCPRCKGDPRPPDSTVHGTETRSFRPPTMTVLSASTTSIDAIISAAPNWMQKCLRLSYLFRVRDSKAAQRLRIRAASYREQREAAVEYVAEQLQLRAGE